MAAEIISKITAKSDEKNNENDNNDLIDFFRAIQSSESKSLSEFFQFKADIVWRNVIALLYLHLAFVYGLYLIFSGQVMFSTMLFSAVFAYFPAISITAGAHRLWTHRAYKATWQFRLILMICNCMTFQIPLYDWTRDHRVHHKYSDTDADPHNISRGFFFSHVGWLMLKKHPDVLKKGKEVDLSDLEQDAIVMFQKRHYAWMMPLFTFILPALCTYYFLGETLSNSWYTSIIRNVFILHLTWSVNSFAHYSGCKPYDKNIVATNNTYLGVLSFGEGWHNYHHVFPWDYKTSELGDRHLNWTCAVIDFFAKIGWAYDLKTVSEDLIRKRAARTGDGIPYKYTRCVQPKSQLIEEHISHHHDPNENSIWGWDDKDMDAYNKDNATIINERKVS